jgi:hypothetical protein
MIRFSGLGFLRPVASRGWTAALLIVASILLATPALVNGFPFVFYDSTGYMKRAVFATNALQPPAAASNCATTAAGGRVGCGAQVASAASDKTSYSKISKNPFFTRPITYSVWLVPFSTALTVYMLPIGQGLVAAYVLWRMLRTLGANSPSVFLGLVGVLTAISSLPLHVSYMMPDVFCGILIVAMFAAICDWPARSRTGRVFDIGFIAPLIATHLSFLPISLAMLALYGLCVVLRVSQVRVAAIASVIVLPMVLAALLLTGSNFAVARKPELSESSSLFLLARLIGDGPARDYLSSACGEKHYLLCAQLPRLTATRPGESISDHFLWASDGAVKQIGDPRLLTEASEINRETIKRYPVQVARNAILNGLLQLGRFEVDRDLQFAPQAFADGPAATMGASTVRAYVGSAQARGAIPLSLLRLQTALGVAAALLAVPLVLIFWRRRLDTLHWLLLGAVTTGFAANALVTGGLSDVHDRYGNRIVWLLPATALVLVIQAFQNSRTSAPSHEGDADPGASFASAEA